MNRISAGEVVFYRSELLDRFPEIGHAFSTRAVGDLSSGSGDSRERVLENRRRFCAAAGADPSRLAIARQVLGSRVAMLGDEGEADALVSDRAGVPILTLSADCVLILLYDPVRSVIANVHASRHGTRGEIAAKGVETMGDRFGSYPSEVVAAIGPSIGPCCYEVRQDVIEEWRAAHGDRHLIRRHDRTFLDLWSATRTQLQRAGVRPENIDLAAVCTKCRSDDFYSHRRDGEKTGRFGALLWIR